MEPKAFEKTPEFEHFRNEMQKLIRVPKSKLDELVKQAKQESPRNGNPDAPGRKIARKQGRRKRII